MKTNRLEAFSDGVIAIIITIMVLELKVPHGTDWHALRPLVPKFLTYLMSFVYLAIYWNNHHHLLQATKTVSGAILWANMHLLFWLSLVPFVTGWFGETAIAPAPTLAYGAVLLMAAVSWYVLQLCIIAQEGRDSAVAKATGTDLKGKGSLVLYAIAVATSYVLPVLSLSIFIGVALIWLVPDRRIEAQLQD